MASGGSAHSSSHGLADRYAGALYDLADEQRSLDRVVDEVAALGRMLDEAPDLRRLVASPLADPAKSGGAVRAVLAAQGASKLLQDFVGVIAANRRLSRLPAIVSAFAALVARRRGIELAQVASAHPLGDVEREQVRSRLIEAGYGRVELTTKVDPSLLGGLVIKVGARVYDSSLRSRLERLHYAIKGAA